MVNYFDLEVKFKKEKMRGLGRAWGKGGECLS
jgi:hypothetical protein